MLEFTQRKQLPHRPDQLFDLVADVGSYPDFLPWCVGARVRSKTGTQLVADLVIGFKMVRESFTSEVQLDREGGRITAKMLRGPFSTLENHWRFDPVAGDPAACDLSVEVRFAFRSKMLDRLIGPVFGEAQKRLIAAFEKRAEELYS